MSSRCKSNGGINVEGSLATSKLSICTWVHIPLTIKKIARFSIIFLTWMPSFRSNFTGSPAF